MAIKIKGDVVIDDNENLYLAGGASIDGQLGVDGDTRIGLSSAGNNAILYMNGKVSIAKEAIANGDSDHISFYHGSTIVGEIGAQDTQWLRINNETDMDIYTPRMIRAQGGFCKGTDCNDIDIGVTSGDVIDISGSYKIDGAHQQLQLGRGDSAVTAVMDGRATVVFPEQPRAKIFGQHQEGAGWEEYDVTGLNHISCSSMARAVSHAIVGTVNCIRATNNMDQGDGTSEWIMNPLGTNWACVAAGHGSWEAWAGPIYEAAGAVFPATGNVAHAEIESKDNGNTIRIYGAGHTNRTDVTCMAW